jgi:hypothetical protein
VLAPLTLSVALVAAGVMVLLDRLDVYDLQAVPFLAVLLGIVGLGLVVGAVVGRGRGLIWMGVLLTLVTAIAAAVPGHSGRTGSVTFAPATTASIPVDGYSWGAGKVTLDLTGLVVSGPVEVTAQVGVGNLIVVVPPDVTVAVHSSVGIGGTRLPEGHEAGGFGRDTDTTLAPRAFPSRGTITLNLDLGIGQLEVRRAQA